MSQVSNDSACNAACPCNSDLVQSCINNNISTLVATFTSKQTELVDLQELSDSQEYYIGYLDSQIGIKEDTLRNLVEENIEAKKSLAFQLNVLAEDFLSECNDLINLCNRGTYVI